MPRLRPSTWAVIAAATALVFCAVVGPHLGNRLVSDDWFLLYRSSRSSSLSALLSSAEGWFFRPLQWLGTWLLFRVAGTHPWPYHVFSAGLHCLNTLLLACMARELARYEGLAPDRRTLVATGCACIFALGPHVHEVVFWYAAVSEAQSTFFQLCGLLVVLIAARRVDAREPLVAAGVGLSYAMALAAKESAVVFPLEALCLSFYLWLRAGVRWRTTALPVLIASAPVAIGWSGLVALQHGGQLFAGGLAAAANLRSIVLRVVQGVVFVVTDASIANDRFLIACALGGVLLIGVLVTKRQYVLLFSTALMVAAVVPSAIAASPQGAAVIGVDRYAYYPSAALALSVVLALNGWVAASGDGRIGAAVTIATLIIAVGAVVFAREARQWRIAGLMADRTLRQLAARIDARSPAILCADGLPDSYRGNYVLRNGSTEALRVIERRDDIYVLLGERGDCTAHLSVCREAREHPHADGAWSGATLLCAGEPVP